MLRAAMTMTRLLFAAVFLFCAGLMDFAFFLQYVRELEPCPLCLFQRLFFIAIGVVALIAALHGPGRVMRRVYAALLALLAASGGAVAARHVWLQYLPPDQVPQCGPDLQYMLDAFPLMEVVKEVLGGSGECAEVAWMFLGRSIPEWTLLVYALLLLFFIWLTLRRRLPGEAAG